MNTVTEQELIKHTETRKGKRVTAADVVAAIASEHFFTAEEGVIGETYMRGERADYQPPALRYLTFCVLVLHNGFTVVGQGACADPAMFKKDIGRRLAREDAINKIWPLMGFQLREEMYREGLSHAG